MLTLHHPFLSGASLTHELPQDNSRSRNIEIVLRAVKVKPADIARAIGCLNTDGSEGGLGHDALLFLKKQWPTEEEGAAVRQKVADANSGIGDGDGTCADNTASLSIPEQFVFELRCRNHIPRLTSKLNIAIFQAEFKAKAQRLGEWVTLVSKACDQVRNSVRLGTMLKVILNLGNTLNALGSGNAGHSGGSASGFRLSSLPELSKTRSFVDDSTTLLHIMVSRTEEFQPHLLDVATDLPDITAASRLDCKDIRDEMTQMKNSVAAAQRELALIEGEFDETAKEKELQLINTKCRDRISSFLRDASASIDSCNTAKMGEAFAAVLKLYGEEANSSLSAFFGSLVSFMELLRKTRQEIRDKKERMRRRAAAAAAATLPKPVGTNSPDSADKIGPRRRNTAKTDLEIAMRRIRSCVKGPDHSPLRSPASEWNDQENQRPLEGAVKPVKLKFDTPPPRSPLLQRTSSSC
eukprot:COSAG01_NODE_4124_length_5329_cov_4.678394_2_plen_466_part_00